MDLPLATKYANHIHKWLASHCDRIEIAGSIRRQRPQCADVDIVCIPKYKIDHDLFQTEQARTNLLWQHLVHYVETYKPDYGTTFDSSIPGKDAVPCVPKILQGSQPGGMQMIIDLPKCQLDLWFTDADSFASRFIQRTGSKEHNVWLAERALRYGLAWKPSQGLFRREKGLGGMGAFTERLPSATEADLYAHLGLKFIHPINREIDWLRKHIDSGLQEAA